MGGKLEQIRFITLLKHDPLFKKWLAKPPTLVGHVAFDPWRVFIQRDQDGTWAYKDFAEYTDAYRTLAKHVSTAHDLALNCKRQAFKPPIVKIKIDGKKIRTYWPRPAYHEWCPFCRRPVIIRKLRRHPAHPNIKWGDPTPLCGICGARAQFMVSEIGECRSKILWPIESSAA